MAPTLNRIMRFIIVPPGGRSARSNFLGVELSFLFSFFVETGLLNCNPVPRRNREPSSPGALNSDLNSADSGLQLDLEIALSDVSAKVQPHELFSPAEDALKRRME